MPVDGALLSQNTNVIWEAQCFLNMLRTCTVAQHRFCDLRTFFPKCSAKQGGAWRPDVEYFSIQ